MAEQQYLYLMILLASVAIPLLRSFEHRIAFYRSFFSLFTAITVVGGAFILWDIAFTLMGFWGFNPKYVSGIYFFGLPLEEIMFFVVIPFCCVFIYRVSNYFIKAFPSKAVALHTSRLLYGFGFAMAWIYHDRAYTLATFLFLALLLVYLSEVRNTSWLGRFYIAFIFVLIPFFVVNGILTGMWIYEEVVWYNSMEFTGIRLWTIPLEDLFYGMLLILSVIAVYEHLGYPQRRIQERETE